MGMINENWFHLRSNFMLIIKRMINLFKWDKKVDSVEVPYSFIYLFVLSVLILSVAQNIVSNYKMIK
jgi:hypothetical protein